MYLLLLPSSKFSPSQFYYSDYKVCDGLDFHILNVHTKFCKNQSIGDETEMVDTQTQTHTA